MREPAGSFGALRHSRGWAALPLHSTPAAAYDRVYIGSTDGKVYSFGSVTGRLRWSGPRPATSMRRPRCGAVSSWSAPTIEPFARSTQRPARCSGPTGERGDFRRGIGG